MCTILNFVTNLISKMYKEESTIIMYFKRRLYFFPLNII